MILFVWSIIFTSIYHQGAKTDEDCLELHTGLCLCPASAFFQTYLTP